MNKERKLKAIKNRIDYCEKRNKHKKIVRILKTRYDKLKENKNE